jgi:hypothetical protein
MWFLAVPHEVGPGEQPDFEPRVADSTDGLRWSVPRAASGSASHADTTRERRVPVTVFP